MLKTLASCMVAVACTGANAADWQELSANDRQTTFVDVSSIKAIGVETQVWVKYVLRKPEPGFSDKTKRFVSSVQLQRLNCGEGTSQTKQNIFYSANGEVVDQSMSHEPASPVVPETSGEHVLTFVCEITTKREAVAKEFAEWRKTHPASAPAN